MSELPTLHLSRIAKSFGSGPVLQDVNLSLQSGERRGLIGPNGAGKTTLINIITGGLAPDSGDVFFQGQRITGLSPYRRNRIGIGRSFQILSLFGEMTVRENLRNALLRHRGLHVLPWRAAARLAPIEDEVAQAAELVGLGDVLKARVDTLPYGMQRRLDIALVLAQEPALVVLDEPAAGLSGAETRDLIDLLQTRLGDRTLLLVEHDMDVVYSLSDRITVLDYGRVLAEGSPAEISANSDVRRVYLGEDAA
ncbi:ABC transporter ATP-binding protein [Acidisoma cellulosilytica]|uniref:ABC transporter ATP-binding protein n=1 Tax=Acidisoma cellulosilyticum TaxID=2802395 RepID=A0A963Z4A1_9PROT|nr:ABC transporter ATP-binding protein [Acidisoma cellulosilyticum]MCB8882610.1 ABC transporter ATP-binding protein [Acidisoma cellulosilyticum]